MDAVDIAENDKLNVQKLEREFSQITNYDVFLNQPTIALTRIDISQHGIYNNSIFKLKIYRLIIISCILFISVLSKASLMNMGELSEENNFGLTFAERPSVINQGNIIIILNV